MDGVSNTRDIGGYQTVYGYVKEGLVYRSAKLEAITDKGLETLKNKLGVKTDLDLRGEAEASMPGNTANPAKCDNYFVVETPQYASIPANGIDYEMHFEHIKYMVFLLDFLVNSSSSQE